MIEERAKTRRPATDRVLRTVALLGCAGILWVVASGVYGVWQNCYPWPHGVSVARVEQITGLRFPADARLLHSLYQVTPGESDLTAVLEMSPQDADALVQALPTTRTTSRTHRLGIDHPAWEHRHAWWTPAEPRRFLAVEAGESGRDSRSVGVSLLISEDNPQLARVYLLRWYGQPPPSALAGSPGHEGSVPDGL